MKIKQAVILAGGKGERLHPLTLEIPKPLIPINQKPLLQYSIELLCKHGVREIILAVSYQHEKIKNYFKDGKDWGVRIDYSIESSPLGTGGAIKNLESQLDNSFFMLNGDNISNFDLTQAVFQHQKTNAAGTLILVHVPSVVGSGHVTLNDQKIVSFMEKPELETQIQAGWINGGTYVLQKEVLSVLPVGFNLIEKTLFPKLAVEGKLFGFKHSGFWYALDTFEMLKKTEQALLNNPNFL
ncbi:MAG: nucleotidyltransferase family protein [Candidatus Diapherotrites archaeon]|nr:nucleotidyltransferase family protein [Candidatus Diapherotrites archaeon]